jgi:hypothetical protein
MLSQTNQKRNRRNHMPKTMVYVARRRCGCVVAAVVDDTDALVEGVEERRKAISDCLRIWIRAGWRVDSMPAAQVLLEWFAICPHDARQPRLDSGATVTVTNQQTGERVPVSADAFHQAARGT